MHRIDRAFRRLRTLRRRAFVAYITAGDPSLAWTRRLALGLAQSGCDVIELGVPFSDPLADGVVNQRAAQRALASGTTLHKILQSVAQIRKRVSAPLILFSYFNPIHRMGVDVFARRAAAAGVDGVLVLDLPPEESAAMRKALRKTGLKMIALIAPTSSPGRIRKIVHGASGFLYCVSRTGVTGGEASVLQDVRRLVQRVKKISRVPVVVGFGISKPGHVRAIGKIADGVVVGSAIVSRIEENPKNPLPGVMRLVRRLHA